MTSKINYKVFLKSNYAENLNQGSTLCQTKAHVILAWSNSQIERYYWYYKTG